MLDDDTKIFIVHGNISSPILTKGYSYEISLWENDPRTSQIGGGYGASGIMQIKYTKLFKESSRNTVFSDKRIISKVCQELKKYFKEKGYTK